jgi:hypothetical protein
MGHAAASLARASGIPPRVQAGVRNSCTAMVATISGAPMASSRLGVTAQ